jgi:hypothetical protein
MDVSGAINLLLCHVARCVASDSVVCVRSSDGRDTEFTRDIIVILSALSDSPVKALLLCTLRSIRASVYLGCTSAAYLALRFADVALAALKEGYSLTEVSDALDVVRDVCETVLSRIPRYPAVRHASCLSPEELCLNWSCLENVPVKHIHVRRFAGVARSHSFSESGLLLAIPYVAAYHVKDWAVHFKKGSSSVVRVACVEKLDDDSYASLPSPDLAVDVLFTSGHVSPFLRQCLGERHGILVVSALTRPELSSLSQLFGLPSSPSLADYDHRDIADGVQIELFQKGWQTEDDVEVFELQSFMREKINPKQHFLKVVLQASQPSTHRHATVVLCDHVASRLSVLEHEFWKALHTLRAESVIVGGGWWEAKCSQRLLSSPEPLLQRFGRSIEDLVLAGMANAGFTLDESVMALQNSRQQDDLRIGPMLGSHLPVTYTVVDTVASRKVLIKQATMFARRVAAMTPVVVNRQLRFPAALQSPAGIVTHWHGSMPSMPSLSSVASCTDTVESDTLGANSDI